MPTHISSRSSDIQTYRRRDADPRGPEGTLGDVVLYESSDARIHLDVRLEHGTAWLTQAQMVSLFQRDQSVVSRHIRNVFAEGELEREGNLQKMHIPSAHKPTELYSLDVVVSVGYRIKSQQGTRFRVWATRTLREHLVRGFTLSEQRLRERGLREVDQAVTLLRKALAHHRLISADAEGLFDIVASYTRTWHLLLAYDEDRLPDVPAVASEDGQADLSLDEARDAISYLRDSLAAKGESTALFGLERDGGLAGILGAIRQTFCGQRLYATVQERGANLLYLIIKDHPFIDGNKRIGALLFLEYLRRNQLLLRPDLQPRLAENALVALALLVAASEPIQKGLMIRLILSLLDLDRVGPQANEDVHQDTDSARARKDTGEFERRCR